MGFFKRAHLIPGGEVEYRLQRLMASSVTHNVPDLLFVVSTVCPDPSWSDTQPDEIRFVHKLQNLSAKLYDFEI